jgi:hypothetical protein
MGLNIIYLVCAVAGGTILVLRLVLMVIGLGGGEAPSDMDVSDTGDVGDGGHVAGAEAGDHAGGGVALNFLSLQSIAGFFTMFGLVGLGLLQIKAAWGWSLLGALVAGLVTAVATGLIFMSMRRLQSEGTLVITNAVGQQGTVYLTIPAQGGAGVVSVTVQGALRQFDAVSAEGQKIPTGAIIQVTGVAAGKILVVKEVANPNSA